MIVELHYERDGRGEPLLLLHGGGLSAASHRNTRFELSQYFDVIAPDTRGHGKSPDADEPHSYAKFADDILALLDKLNIPRAHILGFSDGAVTALHLAIYHPARVNRVIALGGNYLVEGLTSGAIAQMATMGRSKLTELWLSEPNYSSVELAKITAPVLVAIGDRDAIRLEHAVAMHQKIPGSELCIFPGAGHMVLWEQPQTAHDAIRRFLAPKKPAPAKAGTKSLDVIVVGTGGAGSAAMYHLAKRGARVLGIDRFPPGHARGSSHGDTRVIRLAYFESPNYVPLLKRAYELWDELSTAAGRPLIHRTGLIQIGPAGGNMISTLEKCAREYQLEVETFPGEELTRRFPGFSAPPNSQVAFDREGGYLDVEDCVVSHAALATAAGARLVIGEEAIDLRFEGDSVTVVTDRGEYSASKLILTPGAWAPRLLGELNIPLRVVRKPLFWFEPESPAYELKNGAPVFLYDTPSGVFYGLPVLDARGLKVAEHGGGDPVSDPLRVDRTLHASELLRVEELLGKYLPGVGKKLNGHTVCMYTMSPDENFLLGTHPETERICFAAGLSGHGFKFTSALGEILADLALYGRTGHPIDFLSPNRFRAPAGP
jgi:monomeric sarcosine oxidase